MSMTTYESDIKSISSSAEVVFGILSDLRNLQKFQDHPQLADKFKDMEFDADKCAFSVEGFGKIGLKIIEREAFKTIKFESENAPVSVNLWIQLKEIDSNDTRLKLTLKAELPSMIKMMVDKKIKEGINMVADALSKALSTPLTK